MKLIATSLSLCALLVLHTLAHSFVLAAPAAHTSTRENYRRSSRKIALQSGTNNYNFVQKFKGQSFSLNAAVGAASADSSAPVPVKLPLVGTVTLPKLFWKSMMMLICIIWATNFAVIKKVFSALPPDVIDPPMYIATRFSIGALLLLPGAIGHFRNLPLVMNGLLVGLSIFVGYVGQAIGIQLSSASKAAFLCSMNVVWVALVNGLITRKFKLRQWIAVTLAITGAAFIELKGAVMPEIHDLWLLLQPLGFGTGYLILERSMKKFPEAATAFTAFKLMGVALAASVWAALKGHTFRDVVPILSNPIARTGILYTSVVTTAFAIWLQSVVFKNVVATDASIILTSEPIWAAAVAFGKNICIAIAIGFDTTPSRWRLCQISHVPLYSCIVRLYNFS